MTCWLTSADAETLDRVAASVGNAAITESDVNAEHRFELFLKGSSNPETLDSGAFEQARDRLIEQKLLEEEAEAEEVDRTGITEAARKTLEEVRRQYPSEESYQKSLLVLGATEEQVLSRLESEVLTLRLIDQRLRPAAWVERSEIEAYYAQDFAREFARQSKQPVPPVDEVEAQIREILVQKKIDQLLTTWLEELKSAYHVKIHNF